MKSNKLKWKLQQKASNHNYLKTQYAGSMDLLPEL